MVRTVGSGLLTVVMAISFVSPLGSAHDHTVKLGRQPRLYPDYSQTVIPANIAPLNMLIMEDAERYTLRITAGNGTQIQISGRSRTIRIPISKWQAVLEASKGGQISAELTIRSEGRWFVFEPVTIYVAQEKIDRFIVYRTMHPTHQHVASQIKIVCRDLASFDQQVLIDGSRLDNACINCHSFPANRPDRMLIGVRSTSYGVVTLASSDGNAQKIAAKFGYTSWHPTGQLAVFSINNLPMFYHAARPEPRDTVDLDSMIAYFDPRTGSISTIPQLARKELLETWPCWSADGRYLYYCCAQRLWQDGTQVPPDTYNRIRYDLMRIPYDPNTGTWGQPELVLAADRLGQSIAMPRCSPDGRWISFCGCDYGFFPTWQEESDIYLLDLKSGAYRRLDILGQHSQSWHCWSSNSRFLVFSSKQQDGQFTRIMISFIDQQGNPHSPLVIPQADPGIYRSTLWAYNTPELLISAPRLSARSIYRVMRSKPSITPQLPVTSATPKPGTFTSAPTSASLN